MKTATTCLKFVFILSVLTICFSCTEKSTDGYAFDADGSLIHFDEFNTIIGEIDIVKEADAETGKNHIVFSYKGKGVYAPRISLGNKDEALNKEDYNLFHLKFKADFGENAPDTWHLRFEEEGSSDFSSSVKLFNYLSPEKDKNGCYNCFIPLKFFGIPTQSITHAQLFCNNYETRNEVLNDDFDLHYLAFKKVKNIESYYPDFDIPKLDNNVEKRLAKIKKATFIGDSITKNGNNTRAGKGFTGKELFELQKELRFLVHNNIDKAP
ncbi:MAG: hypothetical protein R3182_13090, partial [Draconibacterium sp.]|nr:hypothetical protein [Draconibacterium sp.]